MAGPDVRRQVVLTVDDDEGVRETFRVVLEPEFEVVEAASGTAALASLAARQVDRSSSGPALT